MIVTQILGNLRDEEVASAYAGWHHERAVLSGPALLKRVQRVVTDHGTELGLRLPAGSPRLQDGDLLGADPASRNVIVVGVLSTEVLVIAPRTIKEALFIAHSLGNRHLQAQFFEASDAVGQDAPSSAGEDERAFPGRDVMICQYDHTVQDFLVLHDVPHSRRELVMPEPFRHAEHTH